MEEVIKELNEASFNRLMDETKKLIVVEFYTTTCPVCRSMEPVFQDVAREMKEDAIFVKIDASRNQSLAAFHNVMGVPTFKFFCGRDMMREFQGEMNHIILTNTIKDLIKYMSQCRSRSKIFEIDGYG